MKKDKITEILAEKVHKAWWAEKEKQGFHQPAQCPFWPLPHGKEESKNAAFSKHCDKCHPDMYPYENLAEHTKEYDRVTVRAVIKALAELANVL